ncbi:hypothetical protein F5B22DRAFT_656161 [Xylaria bambusicola]|uniref:uncharacterized protein n=1 Tax=Xylaria bambusicola TaxID=326684 RepID=UPI0020074CAA|nr:uncharacterized protein F5B22DRAFT_656161 [Xylaria bambusicola]KAI0515215.1 hypothetical protein F5B22DRAFT_656161 [Xylaria bambusicola]
MDTSTTPAGYELEANAHVAQDDSPPRTDLIPLTCFICPKNSHFSDLSHLLTHISSKGHLHNMFQLNLSREVDMSADIALTDFDRWYKQNNISALLRARKSAREQRDSQQRRSQASLGFGGDTSLPLHQNVRGGRSNRRSRGGGKARSRQGRTDAINGDIIKLESEEDGAHERHEYYASTHPTYAWPSDSPYSAHANSYLNHTTGQYNNCFDDDEDSSKYEPSELYSPFPPEGTPETIEDDTGALILKGVVYPGMAGFDSATEKDRRMRNQKKDPAVLLKLEANSQLVTRAEEVLDTNLDHQRTRDVYDEPSIDGSEDENDVAVNETRTKRRTKTKFSYTSTKRRTNTRPRQQPQTVGRTRSSRLSSRKSQNASLSTTPQLTIANRRITRSSTNRQIPVHHHGLHPDATSLRIDAHELDDDEGSQAYHGLIGQCLMTPWQISEPMFTTPSEEPHERASGLALRPGNPNTAFASPASTFKKSPPQYSGKENSHLLIKSPSSFSPYLHPSGDSMEPNSYNPLCPQPRDGYGYRLYSPYDEDPKTSGSSGFNPINSSSAYDSAHMPNMTGNPYHRGQSGGDDYPL